MPQAATSPQTFQEMPRLREDPFRPDQPGDSSRVQWVRSLWHSQDQLLARRDRQIEENVRMLAGQQWTVFSRLLGRFVDISHFLSDRERQWRQRPVVNRLLIWFMLAHARMTENPPIITFQPATGDRFDADLAEVMDPIFKTLWRDTEMLEVVDHIVTWLLPGGEAYWKSLVDPNIGDIIEWTGPAVLQLDTPEGPIERIVPDAPHDRDGNPLVQPSYESEDGWEVTGKAFTEHEGGLRVDVLSPLQCRGQWGNNVPWHKKRFHFHRTFLLPEEVYDRYGVEVAPDITGEEAERSGELRRLLFGDGFFGAAESMFFGVGGHEKKGSQGYVDVIEMWHAPTQFPGMQQGPDEAGGRLIAVTRNSVLRDGTRPAPFAYTSPIRKVEQVRLAGRPSGTSVQEAMNPLQRVYNKRYSQILEHGNLSANPIGLVDESQGIDVDDVENEPGLLLGVTRRQGAAVPVEYVKPPPLGEDVYRIQGLVKNDFDEIGQLSGSQGDPPTRDPSGELVKELRFNADRFIGPTQRRFVVELARMVEDWQVILPTIWPEEKMISFAGEHQVLRTMKVGREVFEQGKVNVIPDIESMLPEGRGERRARATELWQAGFWGNPEEPAARRKYAEMYRFPHMARANTPGGQDAIMATTENGRLAQGVPAAEVPIYRWQDHDEHIFHHEEFMKSPDFQELSVEIQQQFVIHWEWHNLARQQVFFQDVQEEGGRMAVANQAAAQAAGAGVSEGGVDESMGGGPPAPPRSREYPEGTPPGAASQPA